MDDRLRPGAMLFHAEFGAVIVVRMVTNGDVSVRKRKQIQILVVPPERCWINACEDRDANHARRSRRSRQSRQKSGFLRRRRRFERSMQTRSLTHAERLGRPVRCRGCHAEAEASSGTGDGTDGRAATNAGSTGELVIVDSETLQPVALFCGLWQITALTSAAASATLAVGCDDGTAHLIKIEGL
jgi:hypothetical protein